MFRNSRPVNVVPFKRGTINLYVKGQPGSVHLSTTVYRTCLLMNSSGLSWNDPDVQPYRHVQINTSGLNWAFSVIQAHRWESSKVFTHSLAEDKHLGQHFPGKVSSSQENFLILLLQNPASEDIFAPTNNKPFQVTGFLRPDPSTV